MSTEDRRAPGAARIPFEGLVEIGGSLGPSFEAQAINVSEDGMHLRTTYLPELGQQVTCRFEGAPGQSVITSGEVLWAHGAETGGEFGIRFTEMDADSVEALKRVCGFNGSGAQGRAGGKVRLYIDGLASPMRAKIRDMQPTAITVASDLGFLQVGKQLELEDAVSGTKRPASIDRVDVAVDPASHIPQLVVTLRYDDLPEAAPGATEITGPAQSRRDPLATDAPNDRGAPDDLDALDAASMRMKGAFARQAALIGPAIQRFAHRAKVTMGLLSTRRRQLDDDAMPRRTTAPPPGGGLHTSGRKVVRGDLGNPSAADAPTKRPKTMRRKMAVATAVMVTAIVLAVAIKKSHHDAAPPSAANVAPPAETLPAAAASPAPITAQVEATPSMPGGPLAGGTGVQTDKPGVASTSGERPGAGTTASDKHLTQGAEEATDEHVAGHKKHARLAAPFGNGPVHHGNVLHLRMDGPVETIEGAQQPTGFVVKIPGRRSLEAAGPLSARDSRIAAIKVSNEPSGAELSLTFKDGVPNYQVSAKGETLVIALAPEGPLETTVAKRDDKGIKQGTRARAEKIDKNTRPER